MRYIGLIIMTALFMGCELDSETNVENNITAKDGAVIVFESDGNQSAKARQTDEE